MFFSSELNNVTHTLIKTPQIMANAFAMKTFANRFPSLGHLFQILPWSLSMILNLIQDALLLEILEGFHSANSLETLY